MLTRANVREIRALRASGVGVGFITAKFKVNRGTIWRITTGRTWKRDRGVEPKLTI
jgi:hypothetical protein